MIFGKKEGCIIFDKNMKQAKGIINEWLKRGKIKNKRLDLILSKLDFGYYEKIYISNDKQCDGSFYYSSDGRGFNEFNNILFIFPRRICLRTILKDDLYEYVEDPLVQDGFKMIKIKSRRCLHYGDGNYTYEVSDETAIVSHSIVINNKEFSIYLNVSYSKLDKLSGEEVTELDNYLELEKYLTSLIVPCSILDVYKKICEISLGDVSQYHSLTLSFSRNLNENRKIETDKIGLGHGKLCELKITTLDGKIINMAQDGSFSYTLINDKLSFKMQELRNDMISYSVCSNASKEIDNYVDSLIKDDINDARCEIADTKKRVRQIFNYDKRW